MTDKNQENFLYTIDEFADCKVMRYRLPGWEALSLKDKQYLYFLSQAALWGRDIFFDQNYKHNLKIRKALEFVLENPETDKDDPRYKDFEIYAKRFFFSNGLHHHYGEKKIFPDCERNYFSSLLKDYPDSSFILEQIYSPVLAPVRRESSKDKDIVKNSSVNFYENLTRKEAEDFYNSLPTDPQRPVSLGLNSTLVKTEEGTIVEKRWCLSGKYSRYIDKIVFYLEKSKEFASNDLQRQYTDKLIAYYKDGDLKTWDEYNILWTKDTESLCDYINGFIETYNDPLGMKATWEALVNYKDVKETQRTKTICDNAQWFEDHSPVAPAYKKKKVSGLSAKVIDAAILAGDCYPVPPIGINLPNADWIRKQYGSKSVTIANLSDAYFYASLQSPNSALKEFAFSQEEIERAKRHGRLSDNLHTDLHECLGHGSGQLLETTPANALKQFSSALEEARADLFALYYLMDEKLVELGLTESLEVGKAQYDAYVRNGLIVQLARIPLGEKVTEAHMQDRKLICEYALLNGKGAIEKKIKDGKTFFVVTDYLKLRKVWGELLYLIQQIKSTGDYQKAKELVEAYGVEIDPTLHKEVIRRYSALKLRPYGGFVNPEIELKQDKEGKVTDVTIDYPESFLCQELLYGRQYSFPDL